MALLTPARGAALAALLLGGCSLTLDPDDLRAELAADAKDGATTDVAASDGSADSLADVAPDTTEVASVETDTSVVADTNDIADTTAVADSEAEVDTGPTQEIVLHYSGDGPDGCNLEYQVVILTQCPQTCPAKGGWHLVVDASDSLGVGTFSWRFAATNLYTVTPTLASGARVELEVDVPGCELLSGTTVGPGAITVELSVDGGPYQQQRSLHWTTSSVPAASCHREGVCPAP
ncbi:MAG: hypothetical protein U1F43_36165 [Myxococcota bacterium]